MVNGHPVSCTSIISWREILRKCVHYIHLRLQSLFSLSEIQNLGNNPVMRSFIYHTNHRPHWWTAARVLTYFQRISFTYSWKQVGTSFCSISFLIIPRTYFALRSILDFEAVFVDDLEVFSKLYSGYNPSQHGYGSGSSSNDHSYPLTYAKMQTSALFVTHFFWPLKQCFHLNLGPLL